ncbi:STAS domain-containing protein [Chromobacterium alticapitis]|uniref:Sulfate transporter n=1 Tax=Chromobacterium alticapitis TaxID=2073169 RepID=A0A2S5DLX3_9NEIS|nr:STAS domain-containing protein [Chromobacterium alticapitis]POZ64054.1 sulfate transporter [Chromobacterium alticapitis]
MPIRLTQDGEATRAALEGEWTIFTAEDMQDELFGLLNHARLVLDLSGIAEMDGCGAQMLAILLAEARRMGKPTAIAAGSPLLDDVAGWLGFNALADRGDAAAEDGDHGS